MHEAASGGVPQGALERSIADMLIGTQRALRKRERALESISGGEFDQQVQLPVSGVAATTWGHADSPVSWEHPFIFSPLQRNPQFPTPQVTHHFEFTRTPSDLVLVTANIIGWNENQSGWLIGAKVRVASCAPNSTGNIPFTGILHLTFEGYAFPTDSGAEDL
jgi:hypothetical protein